MYHQGFDFLLLRATIRSEDIDARIRQAQLLECVKYAMDFSFLPPKVVSNLIETLLTSKLFVFFTTNLQSWLFNLLNFILFVLYPSQLSLEAVIWSL